MSKKYKQKNKKDAEEIIKILIKYYDDAKCGLDFESPFYLVVALILAAQCTDKRVNQITPVLFKRYSTIKEIAEANLNEVSNIVKTCGFYRNKAFSIIESAKIICDKFNGIVPDTMEELTTLRGIGRKSANIILQECFDKTQGIAVDTHVTRISRKIGFSNANSQDKIEKELTTLFDKKYWKSINHSLVWHGREMCIARRPRCDECPITNICNKND